jgi:hypothetical protein
MPLMLMMHVDGYWFQLINTTEPRP